MQTDRQAEETPWENQVCLFVCDPSLHPHGPMQLWFTGRRWLLVVVVVVVVFVVVVVGAGAAYNRLHLYSVCTFFELRMPTLMLC